MSRDLEKLLAYHCAPAIFGLKSSNLVNVSLEEYPDVMKDLEQMNKRKQKVRFEILKRTESHILLLVYQLGELSEQLKKKSNREFLVKYGYPENAELDDDINFLKERVKEEDFPHEIGVFLGYDLNDIKDFISDNKQCLYVGVWKVYSNPDEKIKIFNKFTKCRRVAIQLLEHGYNFEKVIL